MLKEIINYFKYNPEKMYLGFGGLLLTHQIVQVFDSNPYWILFVIINFLAYTGKRVIVVVAVVFFFMFWISWGNLYLTAKEDISTQLIVIGINSLFYLRDMYFLYKYKINIFCEDNKFDNVKFVSLFVLVMIFCGILVLLNPNINLL